MKLRLKYIPETDTLDLWNGRPGNNGEAVAHNLVADFNDADEVVGLTLFHAAELLQPVLQPDKGARANGGHTIGATKLIIDYEKGRDALCLGNGMAGCSAQEVADELAAICDESGEIIGFTIANASRLLTPLFEGGQMAGRRVGPEPD